MNTALKVLRFQLRDVLRNRWMIGYGLLLLGLTETLFRLGGGGERAVVSLLNVVLIFVPLVSVMFGTLYLYGAREFIELLLAQPVGRPALFAGLYAGLALPLTLAFAVGVGTPFLLRAGEGGAPLTSLAVLLGTGALLTLSFTALAFLLALHFDDRARGLGAALLLWLACAVLYDGVVLLTVVVFSDYPLELPLIVLTLLNPMDLGRVLLLLDFDVGALMGYTGAVFQGFFGTGVGIAVSTAALTGWAVVPLGFAVRRFKRRDF
jgi:Cu-processing system permease protein